MTTINIAKFFDDQNHFSMGAFKSFACFQLDNKLNVIPQKKQELKFYVKLYYECQEMSSTSCGLASFCQCKNQYIRPSQFYDNI